ncbi:MAG TPA: M20/M25/M40 family metallo-hydrolase [Caldimonas sp.]|nr:M20/M25/M40 family metallo-hydrolase [Caldimonas sp.]
MHFTRLHASRRGAVAAALATAVVACGSAHAEPVAAVQDLARQQQQPLLDTLRDLVSIESGSKDVEGLEKIAALIAERLRALGGAIEIVPPSDVYRMEDTPAKTGAMVKAEWKGTGTKRILLIAHMDTVYLRGMLKDQPFRVDETNGRAYGLGIADDKQGIALILHTVAMLDKLAFKDYGTLTVLINGDEEISSPGSRSTISRVASTQDAVFSFEGGGRDGGVRLATSGIGSAYLTVEGRASHAGANPEGGVNALYELAHQLLQLRDLSQNDKGLKLNWTVAQAGTNRNVIPARATAQADARALRVADFEQLQAKLQERVRNQLVPDAKVQLKFEVRRPPLEPTPASRALAAHSKAIYDELGMTMTIADVATGGGTDAAFAALQAKGAVVEGFGLTGFGAHSNNAEYVRLDSIVPRLYLTTRLVMDVAQDKVK